MAHWLIKTEPTDYSFQDLQREKHATWTGVKNALAKKHLKTMAKGDELLVYHTGDQKAVVGMAKVVKADPDGGEPQIAAGKALPRPVTLAEIKADKRLKDWGLVKIGRLSVVPTSPEQWQIVSQMAQHPSDHAGR